jgi:RHS repeat-associated protein
MHAHPFTERVTGMNYVRNRWFDPTSGTWLSPDPKGYVDSSNLYAFAGGDPVNGRDPTGQQKPCANTTLASVKATASAGWNWIKANVMETGANGVSLVLDPLVGDYVWQVRQRATDWRRTARDLASDMAAAAERGEATPIHVIGGAADKRVRAVDAASRTGCKENIAAAATGPLLDLAAVRGAVGDPVTPPPTPAMATGRAVVAGAAPRVAPVVPNTVFASSVDDEGGTGNYELGKHGQMPSPRPGKHSHHGVLSEWMRQHFAGYDAAQAPAILMAAENHRATFGVFNRWRAQQRASMGGIFDWAKVSEADMRMLSEQMFDAAGVPQNMRQDYWAWYGRMKNKLAQ